ncbi:MAG: hypothetical protein CL678_17205 [Bdellovibrionaceae bacterium]|nr:hypothetical protein [Pseudobdellovibrionaceae bacterium]|tara:strand:- start:4302 stop:5438 length:1137 start_codon:yes stop_codon:yes gene_type:complete
MSHAIVIGGGIVGLVTASVLSKKFDRVTVIDQDSMIGSDEPRTGVPHGQHLHVLLSRGFQILEDLFPGVSDELYRSGCPRVDWALDTLWENRFGSFPRYESKIKTWSMSRPFLESRIFLRVSQKKNIHFHQGVVTNLEILENRFVGVGIPKGGIEADYCVIAGGQNFSKRILKEFIQNEKEQNIRLTYRTALLEGVLKKEYKQRYYQIDPICEKYGGVLMPIEKNRYLMTLVEYGDPPRPKISFEEFKSLAEQVPNQAMADTLKHAVPVAPLSVYYKQKMHLRKFKLPLNLQIIGDTHVSLNPVFGQGMTLGLMHAAEINKQKIDPVVSKFERAAYFMGDLASRKHSSSVKSALDLYLRLCQRSKFFHYQFLKELHFL